MTGGAGFIGSNLVEHLHEKNNLVVFDNFSTGKKENLDGFDVGIIESSITNLDSVRSAVEGIDYVFHLAALPSVPRSVKDPIKSNEVNVTGTLNVLFASKESGVEKVVYASSSSVYGDTPTLPKVETMMPRPQSPYAVSKLTGEHYCKTFYTVYGLPTASVRYFNVYGPRQDPLSEYAAVIPKFISQLKQNKSPTVYGDGEQTRDFTFVKDAVIATILTGESKNANGEVINVAGGKRITINGLVEKITTLMGKAIEPIYVEPREGDVKHSLADVNKGKNIIGYQASHSLEDGLKSTIAHFEGNQ